LKHPVHIHGEQKATPLCFRPRIIKSPDLFDFFVQPCTPSSSSLRGRQLLNCLALRTPIGPNALPLINQLVV